jgi:RNA polymerase sigma factor (sigma-70 family)
MQRDDLLASRFRSSGRSISADRDQEASDALLLDRFIEQWDQAAFRDLVRRHGRMVLGVCRRILGDPHAAEDAFQATFLLLVRKAGSVRKRASVGPWLYGVARRVALEARGGASRRPDSLPSDPEGPGADGEDGLERAELFAAVHEELGRLPEKYRAPLVLCYLEGLPHEAVARQLGWPIGTVRVRIARGRDLLGARLTRRGLAPAAVLLALSLLSKTAPAVPAPLVEKTVGAAARVAAGDEIARGDVPARVVELERKVRKVMHLTKLKWVTAFALAATMTWGVATAVVPRALAAADGAALAESELKALQGTWRMTAFERDGARKEAEGGEEQLKIEDKTFSLWHGGHAEEKGTITIDPSRNPREIQLRFLEGKHEGKTDFAIYRRDGASLTICWVAGGETPPKDFTTKPGDKRVLLTLKRQEP